MDDTEAIARVRANGWKTHPVFDELGREVAWLATKGNEVHFQVHSEYRHGGIQRNRIRAFARERLSHMGYATTRVPRGDTTNARFVERCGFVKTWSDTAFDYYMLDGLPFERKEN